VTAAKFIVFLLLYLFFYSAAFFRWQLLLQKANKKLILPERHEKITKNLK